MLGLVAEAKDGVDVFRTSRNYDGRSDADEDQKKKQGNLFGRGGKKN